MFASLFFIVNNSELGKGTVCATSICQKARLEVPFDNPDDILILKAPTKIHLKMPSADVVCCT